MHHPTVVPLPPNCHPVPSDGRRHTGPLEVLLHRHWVPGTVPPPALITAVDRLATLPSHLAGRLVDGLEGIRLGLGPITDYEPFDRLRDQPVDSARPDGPRWQDIPAAYWNRWIAIGPGGWQLTRDMMLHEIAHALDDLDGMISDGAEFKALHAHCRDVLVDDRYVRQRHEFFAEAWVLVYLQLWDVLERWLGGATHRAFAVTSWYQRHYGIGR
jgi:hypothetical protein